MRPTDCHACDAAVERSAVLVRVLKRSAAALHVALGHRTALWWVCQESPCTEHSAVVDGRPIERVLAP
jgi:hypothetical protein